MRALVVLPTYNEAENITGILSAIRDAVPHADVLVVDDNSPDGTGELAEKVARERGQITVLHRPAKGGLGRAYRAGFRKGLDAGYEVLIEMDADFSHDPVSLVDLISAVEQGSSLAIGSRYVPGGAIPDWPFARRAISRLGNFYARLMLGIPVQDATAGFRAYRSEMLRKIDLESVAADGYGFQVEMAYRVFRLGGTLTEIPIVFRDREHGHSKMSLRIVVEALLLVTWWGLRDLGGRR